ncbi:GspH/FimT family pseudopilin [Cupriavidus sp. D39]|uniref:GspH/FimT family pseudopilin n=1 Tax=Cupriavidus sp. D39 TaxID=2997877 RepID=UPI00226D9338|nr:GspH/FimT family protein [Cupriavidus sp. D39]MCY0856149.1 GspH/FimT family protein [Cupriavidus sp. D39]
MLGAPAAFARIACARGISSEIAPSGGVRSCPPVRQSLQESPCKIASFPTELPGLTSRIAAIRPARVEKGLTLIELLVALSILAILAAAATPSFTSFLQRARLRTESSALVSDMELARSEAARRNTRVTICPTTDGSTCTSSWSNRRIVFVDLNTDGSWNSATEELLRVSDTPSANLAYTASGFANPGIIRFNSYGTPDAFANWKLCTSPASANGNAVSLSGSGRPIVQSVACP